MDKPKLKPCPFCGCEKIKIFNSDDFVSVCCYNCACSLEDCSKTIEELILNWNQRNIRDYDTN